MNEVLFFERPGGDLLFRVLTHEGPLALERCDAGFEMGSGMDTPPMPPGQRKTDEHIFLLRTYP